MVIPKTNTHLFEQLEDFCVRTKKIANVLMPSDEKIIQLAENKCNSSIFHSGESIPLKVLDSREMKPQIRKLQQQNKNNQFDYEIDR